MIYIYVLVSRTVPSYITQFLSNIEYPVIQGKLFDNQAGSDGTSQVSASKSANSSISVHQNAREREKSMCHYLLVQEHNTACLLLSSLAKSKPKALVSRY